MSRHDAEINLANPFCREWLVE